MSIDLNHARHILEAKLSDAPPPEEMELEGDAATEQGPPDTWAYGPLATAPRESNFISDESLLLWLAQKQDGLYGDLRDHMDMSRERSKLIADLSHVKESIDNGDSPDVVQSELEGLLRAYEGTPFGSALEELLRPTLEVLDAANGVGGHVAMEAVTSALASGQAIGDLSAALQTKIDELGRDDQLELIEIQSLTADIREAGQLASNLLASSNQTANAIVGNIAR